MASGYDLNTFNCSGMYCPTETRCVVKAGLKLSTEFGVIFANMLSAAVKDETRRRGATVSGLLNGYIGNQARMYGLKLEQC